MVVVSMKVVETSFPTDPPLIIDNIAFATYFRLYNSQVTTKTISGHILSSYTIAHNLGCEKKKKKNMGRDCLELVFSLLFGLMAVWSLNYVSQGVQKRASHSLTLITIHR